MQILITGATGFIGTDLCRFWLQEGHEITAFVRNTDTAQELLGPKVRLVTSLDKITTKTKLDAVVNLAGAPVAGWLWTKRYKQQLLKSRLETTSGLLALIERLDHKPSVMISASAAGYYGKQKENWVTEDKKPQDIFMSTLCQEWEKAAASVTKHGVRLVIPRISVVLGMNGGAFPQLARPAKIGMAAILGGGHHYFPWIHKYDIIRLLDFALTNDAVIGPVNAVAPEAVTQKTFTQTLAKTLNRPCFMYVPATVLNIALGELAGLFTEGQRLSSQKIQEAGFSFEHPNLEGTFKDLLT